MWFIHGLIWWFVIFGIINKTSGSSVNKPKFSPCARWNTSGINIANTTSTEEGLFLAFVDINNTLYIADGTKDTIQILPEKTGVPKTIVTNLTMSGGLFVSTTGDIYVDDYNNSRVTKWLSNTTYSKIIMYINEGCDNMFITIDHILYCSIEFGHLVIKMPLNDNVSALAHAAGTGCPGSAADMLTIPFGIYVNVNDTLYVADTGNDRIQRFHSGQSNGVTVVGEFGTYSYPLHMPMSVILDADNNLFIAEGINSRIIRAGPGGSECLIGCEPEVCSPPTNLCAPFAMIFDRYGNIYTSNHEGFGIQKFMLSTNSCDETTTMIKEPETTMPTTKSSTTKFIINQTCFPPIITLFPGPSNFSIPIPFRRSQDFYISAFLKLNCTDSLAVKIKWTIFNHTINDSWIETNLDHVINTTLIELFIPARILIYGIYQLKLTVIMNASSDMFSSDSAFVKITPSGITANLVEFGTSLVSSGQDRELILDPGKYSENPDENSFNASDWTYSYQCRLYDTDNMPRFSSIDDSDNSCFQYRNSPAWQDNSTDTSLSSIVILPGSLLYNRTYQFLVYMVNRRNLTSQATGYLLVRVDNTRPQMVAAACVISTMCELNQEYQFINVNTQIALFSECVVRELCESVTNIQWSIYEGSNDTKTSIVNWEKYIHTNPSDELHFFGMNTNRFTAKNSLFRNNRDILLWRFEVVYTFPNETSSSALNFIVNQPPRNGSCTTTPSTGTTTTLFMINCSDWLDEDEIKDYSFYSSTTKSSELTMLAFTKMPFLELRLPTSDDNSSSLNITVHIRDNLNCVAEYTMKPVTVLSDQVAINKFVDILQNSDPGQTSNPLIQALSSGNQNIIGPVITILSQEFNKRNKEDIEAVIANGTSAISISISSLDSKPPSEPNAPTNNSISDEYIQKLNTLANVRDYLIKVTTDLGITTIDSIKLQANSLAQLTESTNELTRTSCILASNKCRQLALRLNETAQSVSYEDAHFATTQLAHCVNNVLTAINAPLQQRGVFLHTESVYEETNFDDYDSNMELSNLLFNVPSNETAEKTRILYYHKKTANEIAIQTAEVLSLLTSILKIHLNIQQKTSMNSKSLLVSLETVTIGSLANKSIEQMADVNMHIPENFISNLAADTSISLRSAMQPLAPMGASQFQANTNLSTTVSLTVLDKTGKEIPIHTSVDHPIEFYIPRDPNLILPSMKLQDVISKNIEESFDLTVIDLNELVINSNLTVSLHFEIRPLNISLEYVMIYKFDNTPRFNSLMKDIDGSVLFCRKNLTNNMYKYFIDNRKTSGHKLLVIGFRELNSIEKDDICQDMIIDDPSIFDEPFNFTSNYELRIYTSGCYYLDKYNNWQSDGLWVGSKTDHYKTQCFSTHLTTFTSSYLVLPLDVMNQWIVKNSPKKNFTEWNSDYFFNQSCIINHTTANKQFHALQ